jgi:hypothetical protein
MGIAERWPSMVVERSTVETSRKTRGRNHILADTVRIVSVHDAGNGLISPVESGMILPNSDFIVRS